MEYGDVKEVVVRGVKGDAGLDGKDGRDGIDGAQGIQGERGEKGEKGDSIIGERGEKGDKGDRGEDGKDGKDGVDGKDGKDADITELKETIHQTLQVRVEEGIQIIQKRVSSKTYSADEIEGLEAFVEEHGGGAETFESVSKNLKSYPYELSYTGDNLTSIVYDLGGGLTITKTLAYTGENLTSITLSGDIPAIDTIKTLVYTGDNLTDITYS